MQKGLGILLVGNQRELPGHVLVHYSWEGGELEAFKLMMCAQSSIASALLQVGIALCLLLPNVLLNHCLGSQLGVCREAVTHVHIHAPRAQKAHPELLQ